MDNILQCSGYLPTMTLVHNIFIENYMLSANGSYVKVYLYLAKCIQAGEKDLSISTLADKMDNTEKDVLRALHYWEKHNLIHLSKDESGITGIEMLNPEVPVTVHKDKTTVKTDGTNAACTEENTYKKNTIQKPEEQKPEDKKEKIPVTQTEHLSNNEEFIWTCRVIESYVSRPLNPKEVQLISYLYNNLGFSPELLLYLYEYCISVNKTNVNYIQKVAISWHEEGIKNPEDAKNFSSKYVSAYTAISKALALGRQLATIEKQYISQCLDTWNMDLAVILDACNRTVLQLQKGDFKYTKGIIENWHENNVHTIQDIEKLDKAYAQTKAEKAKKNLAGTHDNNNIRSKNQFHQFHQREVSQEEMDELEKKLLAR